MSVPITPPDAAHVAFALISAEEDCLSRLYAYYSRDKADQREATRIDRMIKAIRALRDIAIQNWGAPGYTPGSTESQYHIEKLLDVIRMIAKPVEPKTVNIQDVELDITECPHCHFHLGIDFTYLDQVGAVFLLCPSCKHPLYIPAAS